MVPQEILIPVIYGYAFPKMLWKLKKKKKSALKGLIHVIATPCCQFTSLITTYWIFTLQRSGKKKKKGKKGKVKMIVLRWLNPSPWILVWRVAFTAFICKLLLLFLVQNCISMA